MQDCKSNRAGYFTPIKNQKIIAIEINEVEDLSHKSRQKWIKNILLAKINEKM